MKKIDCRGMTCPKPVLAAKEAVDSAPDSLIEVLVDNEASRENVKKFFRSQGWEVSVSEPSSGVWAITGAPPSCDITHDDPAAPSLAAGADAADQKILVFIPSNRLGSGDDGLGERLMATFLSTLKEMGDDLWRLVLVNSGVKLVAPGSPALEAIEELEASGVSVLVCGTCLEFYGLLDEKRAGETTNMLDIVTSFQHASKVIRV